MLSVLTRGVLGMSVKLSSNLNKTKHDSESKSNVSKREKQNKKFNFYTLRWSNVDPSDQTVALSASGCTALKRPFEDQ